MRKTVCLFIQLILTFAFSVGFHFSRAQLYTAGKYVWDASDEPKVFSGQLQISFVNSEKGFPAYGTVLAGGGYYNTQDGGAFQIFFPYSASTGGVVPQIRLGKYNNIGWSNWSAFFTSANANSSTADWSAKNLYVAGNILINKTTQTNTSYKLDVDGIIRAEKVVVNTTGADYVFDSAYRLAHLDSVKNFIRMNHHLPGIPSAADMQKDGLDVGATEILLLSKIEELTLYAITQNKRTEDLLHFATVQKEQMEKLQKIIDGLNKENREQAQRIQDLENTIKLPENNH